MIESLNARGHAYPLPTATSTTPCPRSRATASLSGKTRDDLRAGARVEVDEAKDDPLDFVLWKAAKPGEPTWDSPWGGAARLAHRMLGDVLAAPRRAASTSTAAARTSCSRTTRTRSRRAEGATGEHVRALLDAQRLRPGRQREDVQVARQLLQRARHPQAVRCRSRAFLHPAGALPQPAQPHRCESRRREERARRVFTRR